MQRNNSVKMQKINKYIPEHSERDAHESRYKIFFLYNSSFAYRFLKQELGTFNCLSNGGARDKGWVFLNFKKKKNHAILFF